MIEKDKLINEIVKYINGKLDNLSNNNPIFNIFGRPYISKMINVNISKLDKALSLITDENGMVDAEGLIDDMADRLIVSKINTINGITIGEGSIKLDIPLLNKTLVLDNNDFNELKTNIEKYGSSK